jgi:hypothetical protein
LDSEPVATTTDIAPIEVSTSTEPATTTTPEPLPENIHISDLNRYSFSSTECVPVGNGVFHCVQKEKTDTNTTSRTYSIGEVYAAPDAGGDLEVFTIADDGSEVQVTHNTEDDSSPSKDAERGDIVWHSLLNDRYQVMYYDKATGVTRELTSERYNNMEPTVFDGVVVWQAWIDNDNGGGWEIMVLDDGEVEQLTNNTAQDILPSIDANYISWQSDEGGEWSAKIYNRKTNHIDTVRGVEGGKVQNPRMVLLFDTTRDNGDTETVGYDPLKKQTVTLGSQPARPLPEDLPIPAPETNDKALIVTQQAPKVETRASSTPDGTGSNPEATSTPPVSDPVIDVGTTTPAVIDMSTPTTTEPVITPAIPDTSSIEDLIIPSFESASTSTST